MTEGNAVTIMRVGSACVYFDIDETEQPLGVSALRTGATKAGETIRVYSRRDARDSLGAGCVGMVPSAHDADAHARLV